MRCFSEDKKLEIFLKLRNLNLYLDYILTLPENIKKIFMTTTCKYCVPECKYRFEWTIEEKTYAACVYKYFSINNFLPGDAKYYAKLIELERGFLKNDK